MKEIIDQLVSAKEDLKKTQEEFRKDLEIAYPCIEKENSDLVGKTISFELEFLLSSSVKIKSGRIKIPADTGWRDDVILTRNPALKRPYESYAAVSYQELVKIEEDGTLYFETMKKKWIKLGILRTNSKIDKKKLEKFYDFLGRFLSLKKKLDNFIKDNSQYGNNDDKKQEGCYRKLKKEDSYVNLRPIHFTICWKNEKDKEGDHWYSNEMTEYMEEESYKNITLKIEREIADNFSEIHEILLELEKEKLDIIDKMKVLLAEVKLANKPFRILLKLV